MSSDEYKKILMSILIDDYRSRKNDIAKVIANLHIEEATSLIYDVMINMEEMYNETKPKMVMTNKSDLKYTVLGQ